MPTASLPPSPTLRAHGFTLALDLLGAGSASWVHVAVALEAPLARGTHWLGPFETALSLRELDAMADLLERHVLAAASGAAPRQDTIVPADQGVALTALASSSEAPARTVRLRATVAVGSELPPRDDRLRLGAEAPVGVDEVLTFASELRELAGGLHRKHQLGRGPAALGWGGEAPADAICAVPMSGAVVALSGPAPGWSVAVSAQAGATPGGDAARWPVDLSLGDTAALAQALEQAAQGRGANWSTPSGVGLHVGEAWGGLVGLELPEAAATSEAASEPGSPAGLVVPVRWTLASGGPSACAVVESEATTGALAAAAAALNAALASEGSA